MANGRQAAVSGRKAECDLRVTIQVGAAFLVAVALAGHLLGNLLGQEVSDTAAENERVSSQLAASEPLPPLTREVLDESLALGRRFLLASQLPSGLFRYRVDCLTGETLPEQSAVRQAGALWGLALLHHDQPTDETRAAVLRGLDYFIAHSHCSDAGARWLQYPGQDEGETGAIALVTLTLIDFLRVEPADAHAVHRQHLAEFLQFLLTLERSDGQFYRRYLVRSGEGWGRPSPYYDGEVLLALVKAARYLAHDELRPVALRAGEVMFEAWARQALQTGSDDPLTKGFFQWGCMAYAEMQEAAWPGSESAAGHAVALAQWMLDVHRPLERRGNTGYALEGVISAYAVAAAIGDQAAQAKFRDVAERVLARLVTWQVGHAQANAFLQSHAPIDAQFVGGVMPAADDPRLRIDTTQHQMHAVILARRYLFPPVGE